MTDRRVGELTKEEADDAFARLEELLRLSPEARASEPEGDLDAALTDTTPRYRDGDAAEDQPEIDRLRARVRAAERRADRRESSDRLSRRSAIIAASGGLLVTLALPVVARPLLGGGEAPRADTIASASPTVEPSVSVPSSAPPPTAAGPTLTAAPNVPVQIDYAGEQAPVVVVVQQDSGGDSGMVVIITAVSAGLVAVLGAASTLVWAIKGRRGDPPPLAEA